MDDKARIVSPTSEVWTQLLPRSLTGPNLVCNLPPYTHICVSETGVVAQEQRLR